MTAVISFTVETPRLAARRRRGRLATRTAWMLAVLCVPSPLRLWYDHEHKVASSSQRAHLGRPIIRTTEVDADAALRDRAR